MTTMLNTIRGKVLLFSLILFISCGSKSNKRAVDATELDKVMQEEAAADPAGPTRSSLSPDELIQLAECTDAACVQLYMKDRSTDFFYGKKGEYSSLNRGVVLDSTATEMIIPFSTLYFSSAPGADWRIAHTVHKKELADQLLTEFGNLGFVLADSIRYHATSAKCYRYYSDKYPGRALYYSPSFTPWYRKGLYLGSKWLGYVFEVRAE